MKVRNTHVRELDASKETLGALLDSLASDADGVWPREHWPRMRFDRPLGVGARGGHGPIRYTVTDYEPGQRVRFRFDAPSGFDGYHEFRIESGTGTANRLVHDLRMQTRGKALVTWTLVYRPLHDALVEDALARAATQAGCTADAPRWSATVRLLRRALARRRPPNH